MKMAAGLPDADSRRNGLNDLLAQLVDEQSDTNIICVVVVDASQILIDKTKGVRNPTVRVQHIEPMLSAAEQNQARVLLERAYRARTSEQLEFTYELEELKRDAPEFYPRPS